MSIEMNPTLFALIETLLWCSNDEEDVPLDRNYSFFDVDSSSLEKLYCEYQAFVNIAETAITKKIGDQWESIDDFYDLIHPSDNQTEHDYILTRNHHGAGFWDGDWSPEVSNILTEAAQMQKEITAYVGDDKKIYFM
jgi:hypothetical protein